MHLGRGQPVPKPRGMKSYTGGIVRMEARGVCEGESWISPEGKRGVKLRKA